MANVHNVMAKQFNVTDFHVSEDELKPINPKAYYLAIKESMKVKIQ